MISEGVLAIEYGASAEDIARTTHAHVCLFAPVVEHEILLIALFGTIANSWRSLQRSGHGSVFETHTHVVATA